jgi:hypothetical protein
MTRWQVWKFYGGGGTYWYAMERATGRHEYHDAQRCVAEGTREAMEAVMRLTPQGRP